MMGFGVEIDINRDEGNYKRGFEAIEKGEATDGLKGSIWSWVAQKGEARD